MGSSRTVKTGGFCLVLLAVAVLALPLVQVNAATSVIFSDAQDGMLNNGGSIDSVSVYFYVGDDYVDSYYRSFVKFNLSGISGTLSTATLHLYLKGSWMHDYPDDTSPLINPGLGDLMVRHINDYGTLDAGDFNAASIGNDPGVLLSSSASPDIGYVSIDVRAAMQDDMDDARSFSSFMIYLTTNTNNDGRTDGWEFYSCEQTATAQDPYIDYALAPPVLSDLAGFTESDTGDVLMVIGDLALNPHGSKPAGVNYQQGRDMTPLGYLRGMLNNSQPDMFDTNAAVNATSGRPVTSDWPLIFSIGGPGINAVTYYYENTDVAADQAPVKFGYNSTHFYWSFTSNETIVPGSEVSQSSTSVPPGTSDVFMIQVLRDGDGRLVVLMYGTRYTGTWAAAEYFKFHVYPTIASYTNSYYIVQWTDAVSDGGANMLPDSGDTFTILAQGTP